jgi:hypothetical protein
VKSNGLVALHHNPGNTSPTVGHVDIEESQNYFSVHWGSNSTGDEQFPSSTSNQCGNGVCQIYDGETCLCDTLVSESIVFTSLPTQAEALAQLSIGAFQPEMFDSGQYELIESSNGVEVWKRNFKATLTTQSSNTLEDYSPHTIFKVMDEKQEYIYLKNVRSDVQVCDISA